MVELCHKKAKMATLWVEGMGNLEVGEEEWRGRRHMTICS